MTAGIFVELDKRYGKRYWRTSIWLSPEERKNVAGKIKELLPNSIIETDDDNSMNNNSTFIYVRHVNDADEAHFLFLMDSGVFDHAD
jgi:hypothetical protein